MDGNRSQQNDFTNAHGVVYLGAPQMSLIVTLCVLVGLSLGVACWALSYADKARMEARVLQVKVEGFENALHAHGLDPHPHLKGQPE